MRTEPAWARPAATLAAVTAVATGAAAMPTAWRSGLSVRLPRQIGVILTNLLGVGVAVAAVLLLGALAVLLRPRRRRRHGPPAPTPVPPRVPAWAKAVALLTALLLIALPAALAIASGGLPHPAAPAAGPNPGGSGAEPAPHLRLQDRDWWAAAALLLAGATTAAAVRWRRRTRSTGRRAAAGDQLLSRTVDAGRRALADAAADEPRAAVSACYRAMSDALTGAGLPSRPSDTPTDLLVRALAAGTVHGPPAQRLTDLFARARYSRHPITATHVAQAAAALDGIEAQLGGHDARSGR